MAEPARRKGRPPAPKELQTAEAKRQERRRESAKGTDRETLQRAQCRILMAERYDSRASLSDEEYLRIRAFDVAKKETKNLNE